MHTCRESAESQSSQYLFFFLAYFIASFIVKSFAVSPKQFIPNMAFHVDNNSNNYKLIKGFLAVNLKVFHKQRRSAQQFWMVTQILHCCFSIPACLRGTVGDNVNLNLWQNQSLPMPRVTQMLSGRNWNTQSLLPLKKCLWSIYPFFLSIKFFQKLYVWKTSNFWLSFFPSSVDVIRFLQIIELLNIAITCLFELLKFDCV